MAKKAGARQTKKKASAAKTDVSATEAGKNGEEFELVLDSPQAPETSDTPPAPDTRPGAEAEGPVDEFELILGDSEPPAERPDGVSPDPDAHDDLPASPADVERVLEEVVEKASIVVDEAISMITPADDAVSLTDESSPTPSPPPPVIPSVVLPEDIESIDLDALEADIGSLAGIEDMDDLMAGLEDALDAIDLPVESPPLPKPAARKQSSRSSASVTRVIMTDDDLLDPNAAGTTRAAPVPPREAPAAAPSVVSPTIEETAAVDLDTLGDVVDVASLPTEPPVTDVAPPAETDTAVATPPTTNEVAAESSGSVVAKRPVEQPVTIVASGDVIDLDDIGESADTAPVDAPKTGPLTLADVGIGPEQPAGDDAMDLDALGEALDLDAIADTELPPSSTLDILDGALAGEVEDLLAGNFESVDEIFGGKVTPGGKGGGSGQLAEATLLSPAGDASSSDQPQGGEPALAGAGVARSAILSIWRGSIGEKTTAALRGANYPLRYLPPSWRWIIDWLALTLVLWVPAVWLLVWMFA